MERLKETSRLFLRDAEKDPTNKKYATCIVHLHMAAEHALKAHLLKLEEETESIMKDTYPTDMKLQRHFITLRN